MQRFKYFIYNLSGGFSLLPFQFTINIANPCNRKCNWCPNHSPHLVPDWYMSWWMKQPRFMDVDKFADFMKRMGFFRLFIRQLSFTGRGETLLHKDILKFCEIAEKYRIKFHITTNGDFLTPRLEYSLSQFKYLHYVRVSLFDVERFGYWDNRAYYSPIKIIIQNVTGRHIEGLADGFLTCTNPGTDQFMTLPKGFVKENSCAAPFSFNTLNTDGTMVTCITFVETGNVFKESFWKCWNGKKIRQVRRQALKMALPEHKAFCRDCGVFMRNKEYWKLNQLKK